MERTRLHELISQRLKHLREWIDSYKQIQERVPEVQKILERTEWEAEAIESSPEDADEFMPMIADEYSKGNDFLFRSLPLPIPYPDVPVSSTASITSSGTVSVYSFVSSASQVEDKTISSWARSSAIEYQRIQESQSRYEQVANWLKGLDSDVSNELEFAYKAYSASAADVGTRVSTGISIRNVLEHVKGVLLAKATLKSEQKILWETMAERLTRGDAECQEVRKQEAVWKSLHSRLTQVAKGQKTGLVDDLDDIWVRLIDHLFILSGLVSL